MNKIAILGSGRVGTSIATGLAAAGYEITLGVRNIDAAREKWQGPTVSFADLADAAGKGDVIVNAMPGDCSVAILSDLRDELAGKLLIDVANATVRRADGMPGGLLYPDTSLGEELQAALPDTLVVKTLNTVLSPVMSNPSLLKDPANVFVSGNDPQAKAAVGRILTDLGWSEQRIEDLGGIDSARGTEALILLAPYLLRARGLVPFALTAAR